MTMVNLDSNNFQKTISENDIVVIDYWAPWCGPCRMFGPIFEQAAEKHPDITFAKVNTEEQQELAAAFQIRSIPTLMVFRQSVLLFAQPGMLPAPALEELIGQVKELDMLEVKKKIEDDHKKGDN